uniref:Mitochondrial 2-oxoglutarate/malate carrier protein n=1 Tax=Panagrolaimus sp. PS1159 TaxID=55785 RepID=A0AC35FCP1_9BILA
MTTTETVATKLESAATTKAPSIPFALKLAFGGLAGMGATMFVQPLDLVKNRMQLSGTTGKKEYTSSFQALRSIIAKEGIFAVYNGLSAGLARQASYTTTRLGVYTFLFEKFSKPGESPSFAMKAGLGMTAGAVGAFVGNPTEVALIRMTGDGRLPMEQRRNYKNVFDAIFRIFKEEGVSALWRGCGPTVGRAMVVNAAQLATYSQAKQAILASQYIKDGIFCHFLSSMISGLATTIASMPVDIVKTRIQNMKVIDGKPEYKGAFDVLGRIVKNEGVFALWKGFTPYYLRLGPHTVITFIILEQMNAAYYKYVLGVTGSSAL